MFAVGQQCTTGQAEGFPLPAYTLENLLTHLCSPPLITFSFAVHALAEMFVNNP